MRRRPAAPGVETRAWLGLGFLSLVWGTSFLLTDLALRELAPARIVAGRIVVAATVLNALRLTQRLSLPRAPAVWLRFTAFALTGSVLPFLLISWGQAQVPSGLAGILMTASPLVTAALAHVLVEGERASGRRLLGLGFGALGVALLLDPSALHAAGDDAAILRPLAILGGAFCYAINTILVRRLPAQDPLVYGSGVMLVAAPLAMAQAALLTPVGPTPEEVSASSWIPVAWLGLFPTAAATLVHYRVVALAGPTFASLTSYLVPVVALLAGILVLDEPIGAGAITALALIAIGVFLARSPSVAKAARPAHPTETSAALFTTPRTTTARARR
jgi:drug/metabolite transporter (DMT)-like permease